MAAPAIDGMSNAAQIAAERIATRMEAPVISLD
jgi:hypothetical protein